MDLRPQLAGEGDDFLQIVGRAGVGSVRPQHDRYPPAGFAVPVAVEGLALGQRLLGGRRHPRHAAGQHRPDAANVDGPGDLVHEKIHIGERRRAAADHLGDGQHRPPVDVVAGQAVLGRPYFGLQPVHEGHIVRIAAEQGHGGVGVGVDEAGHHQLVGAVDHPVGRPVGGHLPHPLDRRAGDRHVGLDNLAACVDLAVPKQYPCHHSAPSCRRR